MSILKVDTIQDQAGGNASTPDEIYSGRAKAWVNFDGTTGTLGQPDVTIRASFNVSSVTDNSAGNYTVNFTNAMPDANYAPQVTSADVGTGGSWTGGMKQAQVSAATGSVRISGFHGTDNGEARDTAYICVAIFL